MSRLFVLFPINISLQLLDIFQGVDICVGLDDAVPIGGLIFPNIHGFICLVFWTPIS